MIYYFSATGNSKALALALSESIKTTSSEMCAKMDTDNWTCKLDDDEILGFVFPVYGWSLPNVVKTFIKNLKVKNYHGQYVFFAVTCGDDIGVTDLHIRKALHKIGLSLNSGFSILMPDCYVNLPGFDVDKDDERRKKLGAFSHKVNEIANAVNNRLNIMKIKRGALPYTKTYVLGGLFRKFLVTDKPFHITNDCTHCGLCEKVCLLHNVKLNKNNTPSWNGNCTGCLACYHHCPVRAIRFGSQNEHKGQYLLKTYKKELR